MSDRDIVQRLTVGSRLYWAWIGATVLWCVVTAVQLIWHGTVAA